tara:strand:- start:48 stop:314 length:267 start_codon:yes stop_codon:yes gene_type:complete
MADFTITLTDLETKCMTYVCTDTDEYITNAAQVRAGKGLSEIIRLNFEHCNANSITIATGEAAQVDQAFALGIVKTAVQRQADFEANQ